MVKFELRKMYEPFVVGTVSADEIESVVNRRNKMIVVTLDGRVIPCDSMVLVNDESKDGV